MTALQEKFAEQGVLPRDVHLKIAFAKFRNNGGTKEDAQNALDVAYEMGGEGQFRNSLKGHSKVTKPTQTNDGGKDVGVFSKEQSILSKPSSPVEGSKGQVSVSDKDCTRLPIGSSPSGKWDLSEDGTLIFKPNGECEGHRRDSAKDKLSIPSPSPQKLILESRNGTALSVLDTFKVRDGRKLRDLTISDVRKLHAVNATEAYVMQRILHHYSNASGDQKVSDLFKPMQLEKFIKDSEHVQH